MFGWLAECRAQGTACLGVKRGSYRRAVAEPARPCSPEPTAHRPRRTGFRGETTRRCMNQSAHKRRGDPGTAGDFAPLVLPATLGARGTHATAMRVETRSPRAATCRRRLRGEWRNGAQRAANESESIASMAYLYTLVFRPFVRTGPPAFTLSHSCPFTSPSPTPPTPPSSPPACSPRTSPRPPPAAPAKGATPPDSSARPARYVRPGRHRG